VRPIRAGRPVVATGVLGGVEGRGLSVSGEARDEAGDLVGSGRIVRIVVDRRRFEERVPPAQ